MPEIIRKYGKEEWRVCVLTNEIHGHLGSYSIVGAKMGIKAREILHADIDRINVVTFAGTSPPFSCMNDGLQISTGATLGLGMIEVRKDTTVCPSAIFSYQGKKIRLTLKKSLQSEIDKDISAAILKYGGLTHGYWELIRIVSLKHWLEFDRNEIFDIEVL
jgi:pyrimidine-specific ribonucleoside hydrolase